MKHEQRTTGFSPRRTPGVGIAVVLLVLIAALCGWSAPYVASYLQLFNPAHTTVATSGYTEWDPAVSPDYYRVVGPAQDVVELTPGQSIYEGLDWLGRTGAVRACVTAQMMEEGTARERGDISRLRPSGWGHNARVTIPSTQGHPYTGSLFNRSHLLAKSLGGRDVIENLVTGTRTQNVGENDGSDGGMAFPEGLARRWLRRHPNGTVYYAATPVYEGSDLLCRSVLVDMRSSDGSIDVRVEVYNTALGYRIDYATGGFEKE